MYAVHMYSRLRTYVPTYEQNGKYKLRKQTFINLTVALHTLIEIEHQILLKCVETNLLTKASLKQDKEASLQFGRNKTLKMLNSNHAKTIALAIGQLLFCCFISIQQPSSDNDFALGPQQLVSLEVHKDETQMKVSLKTKEAHNSKLANLFVKKGVHI